MSATDPELYLRLVGERTLLADGDTSHWGQGDLGAAASALVAVAALPMSVAIAVVEDYRLAIALREDGHARTNSTQPPTQQVTEAPAAPVVAVCRYASAPSDDEWAWSVRYVVFGDSETVLTVRSRTVPPWAGGQAGVVSVTPTPGGTHPGSVGTLSLADDTGHVEQADFTGAGRGAYDWSGEYRTAGPLSPSTSWLEFDGRRLELLRPVSPPTVRVEDHGSGSPAERYLRHRLAAENSRHGDDGRQVDAAVEALVATGVLDPDSPIRAELEAIRAVRAAGGAPTGARPPGRIVVPTALPEPWASAFRTAPPPGPAGVVPLGAVTPVIEGAVAVFRTLSSTAECFVVETIQVGGDSPSAHGDHVDQNPSFAWWAQDNLGQWYRGERGRTSGDEKGITGQVIYYPQLDPRARILRLLPTMPSRRAVVEITLPEWGAAGRAAAPRPLSRNR